MYHRLNEFNSILGIIYGFTLNCKTNSQKNIVFPELDVMQFVGGALITPTKKIK